MTEATEAKGRVLTVLTSEAFERQLMLASGELPAADLSKWEAANVDAVMSLAMNDIFAHDATLREAICGLTAGEWEQFADTWTTRAGAPGNGAWAEKLESEARAFRRLAQVRRALGEEGDGG